MEEIKRQVAKARRRMNVQQMLAILPWTLFVALLVATAGVAIPKIWVVSADPQVWFWSWTGGALAAGIIAAAVLAVVYRRGALEAAIELDRRFGLKERVSSTLALSPDEMETEVGRALVADAVRRVERVEVAEQFPLRMNRPALLPLIPAFAVLGLLLVENAIPAKATTTAENPKEVKKAIKKSAEKLQSKLRDQQKKAVEEGLKDADGLLKELNKQVDKLADKTPADRKEALIKLNDMAKEIEQRKKALPSAEEMKKQLEKLSEIDKGPADKVAEAMKEGDFGKAQQELNKLKDQLAKGEMGKEEKEKLAEQLEKMKQKLEERQREREQQKQDLKEKIEQKKQEGNAAEAGRLQQKLEEMEAQDQQMQQKMDKMAEKFGECAQCMKEGGDPKQAGQKMQEIAEQMEDLKKQIGEGEQLEEMMQDIADAKDAMKCEGCQGEGCKECQGEGDGQSQGKGKGKGDKPGDGMGEGQGFGRRPETETDKKFYDSRVKGNVRKGESVRTGDAGGPNIAGKSKEDIKAEIRAEVSRDADALEDQTLSREQREHTKQYFQRLRKGE